MENNYSIAAEFGKRVLYFINRPTSTLQCLYIEPEKLIFGKLQRNISGMLLICGRF